MKVYDYFMRGEVIAASQAFVGHLKYAHALCLSQDMRHLYSVGPQNGIYRWGFYGDRQMPDDLLALFEKTAVEIQRDEEKEK